MLIKLTRYEDGTDRCPECGSIKAVRGIDHRPWCPTLRRLEPADVRTSASPPAPGVYTLAEQPPAPGPIWTNGLAEQQPPSEVALRRARRLLEHFKREVGQQWAWAALNYMTAEYRELGLDETCHAMLHLIAEEMHG